MSTVEIVGELDATFAWDGNRLLGDHDLAAGRERPVSMRGAAGMVGASEDGTSWRIVRDPLGLNKLFWASRPDGGLVLAARPWLLVARGYPLDEIAAVPRGLLVDLDLAAGESSAHSLVPDQWPPPLLSEAFDLERVGREIRVKLDRYIAAIAARHRGASAFVCLSGGIDSTGIAALVAEHFPDAVAVSFDLVRPGGGASEDRRTAARVARRLGLPLLEATVTSDELLDPLDLVLREGIDWRDFNVHAALVNAALARTIAESINSAQSRPLVFTGDLANEFLVDYQPEQYRGETFYALPRVDPVTLRWLLVKGLDSCHREVGVFEAWGTALIQPYAVAVDTYLRLPEALLRLPDRKERLSQAIFDEGIPDYVLARPKTRAQVGGQEAEPGVLATCIDRGIDDGALRRRFAQLHGGADDRSLDRFIRAGRYRAKSPRAREMARERR